jgi:hypothetical protein
VGRFDGNDIRDNSGRLMGCIDGNDIRDTTGRLVGSYHGVRPRRGALYFFFLR